MPEQKKIVFIYDCKIYFNKYSHFPKIDTKIAICGSLGKNIMSDDMFTEKP